VGHGFMKIIRKLWLLVALATFSLVAAFTAAGFLQAGLSLPSTPPLLAEVDKLADVDKSEARPGLLNGYKGYRHHRAGFRRHEDGWWYPREAFGDVKKEEKREKTQDVSRLVLSPMKEMEEKKEADIAMIAPLSEPPKLIAPQTIVQEVVETQVLTEEEAPKTPIPQEVKPPQEARSKAEKTTKPARQAQAKGEKSKRGRFSAKHVAWCAKKYRSYRAADNMFQPLKGKRKACRSPYA